MEKNIYQQYVALLKEELMPAMGCTEPIALAFAGAKGRELLGKMPDRVVVKASGSIIKNVKSVIVPNTNQMKGMPAAVSAGIVGGKSELQLEVISEVTPEQAAQIKTYVDTTPIKVEPLNDGHVFDLITELYAGEEHVTVRVTDFHTNIVYLEKNGEVLLDNMPAAEDGGAHETFMTLKGIWEFANTADLKDVEDVLQRQIDCNWAIAEEGMKNQYGANIGKVLLDVYGDDVKNEACFMAAAGSDARMNGCEMPVVVNCGSGNQGMTISLPIIVYAKKLGADREKLMRALLVGNLIALFIKSGIGRLSAYCGAVSAGASAASGVAYLHGADFDTVIQTAINALATTSGMICDGAKASCASKIAVSVYAGLLGYEMCKRDQKFHGGDGIVVEDAEATMRNVGRLGSVGMYGTNLEIISMMTEE